MPKGKPWSIQEEKQLRGLRADGKSIKAISVIMKKSQGSIKQKLRRLGFKQVVVTPENQAVTTTSTELIVPEDLPSVEEALLKLAAAMKALEKPGLSKTEIMRLRALIQATGSYQKKFADYINYRKIEQRVIEATEELERLAKREQERADKPRITGKGFTRSRTSLHNGARAASFIRPNNQAKGKEVTTKE